MGPGGKGVKNSLYLWELGVRISFKECSNISIIKEDIFPGFRMSSELFCHIFRERFFCCLYAVFGDCGCPAALPACVTA